MENQGGLNIHLSWADKVQLGEFKLKNRIFLAALTRQRCDVQTGVPDQHVVEYYSQRSGAGLLLTECVAQTQRGESYPGAANLYTKQQAEGWKLVVDAVHKKGSLIFVQIFHGGRSALVETTRGLEAQAPSAIPIRDNHFVFQKPHQVPHQMTIQLWNVFQPPRVFITNLIPFYSRSGIGSYFFYNFV